MNVTVTQLTNQLLASYAKEGGINHLDGKNLPSKRVVTSLAKDLLRLLFPGFFDEKCPVCGEKIGDRGGIGRRGEKGCCGHHGLGWPDQRGWLGKG